MPKVTKDSKIEDLKKPKTVSKKTNSTTKSTKKSNKKIDTKKEEKNVKKTTTKKSTTSSKKKAATSSVVKKKTSSTVKRKTSVKTKKIENNIVAEYYDLPYRYNETVVKILYQTPNVLFVYWDISDNDRNSFIKKYGKNFFYNTKPILKIFNITKKYNFEIEINDFANSWYIDVSDANCDYKVELGRKKINYEDSVSPEYTYVYSSNDIQFPNDHILLEELPNIINFKNIKTNEISAKNISTLHLIGINKIYNVNDFYKKFYKDEILEEINSNHIINPSSSS